jgi:hypothetical protein
MNTAVNGLVRASVFFSLLGLGAAVINMSGTVNHAASTGSTYQQIPDNQAQINNEREAEQQCIAKGEKWLESPFSSSHYCTVSLPYNCENGLRNIITSINIREEYRDKTRQSNLDMSMGRRADYHAIGKEQSWNQGMMDAAEKAKIKDAKEYLANGCTKEAEWVRGMVQP